jgi:CubicO group peptidase (beta-lactamase class C family)
MRQLGIDKVFASTLTAMMIAIGLAGAAFAQSASPNTLNPEQVESWANTFFEDAWEHRRFSGATVVLVQDGEIVFANGYGWHDYAAGERLDVDRTGFHLGSIGKVFTATGIGQLLESGAIVSIDDPANLYLTRFQLPDAPNRAVTLRDLLTHRGGFEDWFYGIINDDPVQTPQTGEIIEHFMPDIVTDAGDDIIYSSFGVAMLGAVIEDVTGQTYRDYVAQNIFQPLGMYNSEIPYDPVAPDYMGRAYSFYPSGEAAAKPRVITYPFFAPAGVAIATPSDFGRFMMAQLGELDGQDVLGASLRERLHTELARNHPSMTGIAMLFGRLEYNNQNIVYHAGNGPGFDSFMALFPDQNAGVFIATMGQPPAPGLIEGLAGGGRLVPSETLDVQGWLGAQEALGSFLVDSFGPVAFGPVPVENLERYEGTYWGERRSHSTWEAMLGLAMNFPRTVIAAEDGLMIDGRGPYLPIGNDTFQRADDSTGVRKVAFSFDGENRAQNMHGFPGLDVEHRVTGLHPGVLMPPFLIGMALLASGLLCMFYPYGRGGRSIMTRFKWLPPAMFLTLLLGLLAVIAGHAPEEDLFFGIGRSYQQPWRFTALILAINGVFVASLIMVYVAVKSWPGQYWARGWIGAIIRGHFALVTAGWLAVMPLFAMLNLIGWHWP